MEEEKQQRAAKEKAESEAVAEEAKKALLSAGERKAERVISEQSAHGKIHKKVNEKDHPKRTSPLFAIGVVSSGLVIFALIFVCVYLYNSMINTPTLLPLQDYFSPNNINSLNLDLAG